MLDKFVNNKLSEKDEDRLLKEFYKKEEELEFINKWNERFSEDKELERINDNQHDANVENKLVQMPVKDKKGGLIYKLRTSLIYKISAAMIILFIGASASYINNGPIVQGYKYEYLIKGKKQEYKKCNKVADIIENKIESSSNKNKALWSLYKSGKYKSTVSKAEKILVDSPEDQNTLMIAVISTIRSSRYDDSYQLLNKFKMDSNSLFYEEFKELYDLNKFIVE